MNFKPGSKLEIVDPQTVRFVFPEPDGGALVMYIADRQFYRGVGWRQVAFGQLEDVVLRKKSSVAILLRFSD